MSNCKRLRILEVILISLLLTGMRPPLLGARIPLSDSEVAMQLGKDIGRVAAEATASNSIPKFKREVALNEYCAVLLHLTDQVALNKFDSEERKGFMASVNSGLVAQLSVLKSEGVLNPDRNIGELSNRIKKRRAMYSKYDTRYSGSLPWAFGKWMAKILDSSQDMNVILEHTYTMWHSFEKLKVTDRMISLNAQSDN
ncbi:MAG: hypothetical protein ACE5I0_07075 [Candidatus Binatia bacterium]